MLLFLSYLLVLIGILPKVRLELRENKKAFYNLDSVVKVGTYLESDTRKM